MCALFPDTLYWQWEFPFLSDILWFFIVFHSSFILTIYIFVQNKKVEGGSALKRMYTDPSMLLSKLVFRICTDADMYFMNCQC